MELNAIPIVKGKFWIVKKGKEKVATIQASPAGVVYVQDEKREHFVSIKLLKNKYNISFTKTKTPKKPMLNTYQVHGFPCDHKPHNSLLDLGKKLPIFTKTTKSKSYFCAGYYLIKFNAGYVMSYCPKLITLTRYPYQGPFKTKTKCKQELKIANQTEKSPQNDNA